MTISRELSNKIGVGLARLPVARQLYTAFSMLLLLTVVLGGTSLYGLQRVDSEAQALSGKWLAGVGLVADMRLAVMEARDLEIKHSHTDDASYHGEYEDKMKDAAKLIATQLSDYAALGSNDAERSLLAALRKAIDGYEQSQGRVVALGREHKQQDAADVSDGASSMSYDETLDALNALTHLNFDGGKASAKKTHAVYVMARWGVAALLAVGLVLGFGCALLITRHLLAQLGGEPALAVRVAKAVAEGDLTTPIHLRRGDAHSLMAWLHTMQVGLAKAVANVREGSDFVATASMQIAQGNQDLSSRTEQQASSLQQTAATMEELGATVRHNADNASEASRLAQGASAVAVKGGEVVGQVVDTMQGINDSSRKIADIIGVIDGIAFQTNILALNAAVEAARAGEQGRGFAVVAGEVRSLARRSADAAKEIKSLINASVEKVDQGGQLVQRAGQTMNQIVESIQQVAHIVGEISTASEAQRHGMTQMGETVSQMDQSTQQNAALVEQSAAAAESLKVQAQQLVQAVAVFRLEAAAA